MDLNNILNMIRSGQNPQQLVMNLLSQRQDPMSANLLNLARQGKTAEIEQIARNMYSQTGKDFDTDFRAFRQRLGI